VENLKRLKPDLLFFSGDQVYNHSAHLTYWLKFGRDFGELISSLRIKGQSYQPKVPDPGNYNILIGESGQEQKFENFVAKEKNREDLKVTIH
jgi:hypothetical protein